MMLKFPKKLEFLRDKKTRADLRRFFGFVYPYRYRALLAMVFSSVVGSMGAGIAYLAKPYMDGVILGQSESHSLFFPLLIVVYTLVESCFNFGSDYTTTWVGQRVANDIKMALFKKLVRVEARMYDATKVGEVLIRYAGDADTASAGLLGNIKSLVVRTMTSVGALVIIFYQSWVLALVTVVPLMATIVPLMRVRRRVKEFVKRSVETGAVVGTNYNEAYYGNRVITSFNLYDYVEERLKINLKFLFRLSVKMVQRTNVLSLVMHLATAIGLAVALWLQAYLIRIGHITPGNFASCIAAMFLLYTPVKKISSSFSRMQVCLMAIQRVLNALDREPEVQSRPNAVRVGTVSRNIVFKDVGFAYEPDRPVLRNINLEVEVGQSLALVGNSGCGKSTLVSLLPRFYDVCSGSISFDGKDIRDIELDNLRNLVAVVFQDSFLFGGTIRENILMGRFDATEEQINAAVKAACLDEYIAGLELGLETHVGERGTMLSGGQRQRVAIARAFLKDAPIVVLDEATSALDTQSEAVVQRAIENLMHNKTVFIIAHRLSTVINADSIAVLRDGVVVERGSHSELLARPDSVYASLYNMQLK